MSKLRALIAVITSLAIVTQPVLATLMPCCCQRGEERAAVCCQRAKAPAAEVCGSCCARRSADGDRRPDPESPRRGCCCVKPAPDATPPKGADDGNLHTAAACLTPTTWTGSLLSPTGAGDRSAESRHVRAGPGLLALYCTWLK